MLKNLEEICSNQQGAWQIGFKKGRWIHENHLLIKAAIHKMKSKKKGAIIFVDFKKAYDSIDHFWLYTQFARLNGVLWSNLIMDVVCGGSAKLLGDKRFISINRGVRQGDPLSPLLFNVCLAPLLDSISNSFKLFKIAVPYIAFADDLAIFCNNQLEDNETIRTLQKFKDISGLDINFSKTKLFAYSNINYSCVEKVNKFRYLGITYKKNGKILWDDLFKKFKERLERVTNIYKYSSLLHRIILINSYVLSILIFPIRVAKLPKGFANKVYLAIRSCLGSRGTRVRLTRLLGARSYGGYGLINLKEMALRLK